MIENQCKQNTSVLLKMAIFGAIIAATVGCSSDAPQNNIQAPSQSTESISSDKQCDILSSKDWALRYTDETQQGDNSLVFSAQVTMPTPGYKVEIVQGPLNRRQPPDLIVHVVTQAPTDMVIQMISEGSFESKLAQPLDHYQRISVQCGNETVAEFVDVVRDSKKN